MPPGLHHIGVVDRQAGNRVDSLCPQVVGTDQVAGEVVVRARRSEGAGEGEDTTVPFPRTSALLSFCGSSLTVVQSSTSGRRSPTAMVISSPPVAGRVRKRGVDRQGRSLMGGPILLGQSSGASPAPDLRLTRHEKLPFDPSTWFAPRPPVGQFHKSRAWSTFAAEARLRCGWRT